MKRVFTITCQKAQFLLSRRMDKSLDPAARLRLEMHLRVCDACTRVGQQFVLLRDAARKLDF